MNDENKKTEILDIQQQLESDLTAGIHSVLYKRINKNVIIDEPHLSDAFARFTKYFEVGDTFSVIDIITAAETLINGGQADENATNLIYSYDYSKELPKRIGLKLLKNSYNGIHSLFTVHNGVSIDLDVIGGSIARGETKRFLVMPSRRCASMISKCEKYGMKFSLAGEILQSNKILLTQKNTVVATLDKSELHGEAQSIKLDSSSLDAFLSGYSSICSLVLCNNISKNNVFRFGLGGRLEDVCARALGFYSGLMYLKPLASRVVFYDGNGANIAVQRPTVSDGDYLYLLKLRTDFFGLPDKSHYGQLYYYIVEKKREGIIKDVLPVRENIQGIINRLCDESFEYVSLSEVPENCFGLIVSVGRGESVNGAKLGYFKSI